MRNSLSRIWASQHEIPRQIQQIIGKLDRGALGLHFQLEKLEQLVNSLENASNRLTTGILTGAIIMGSSMIITTGVGPYLFGFPALGVIGYLWSVVLGFVAGHHYPADQEILKFNINLSTRRRLE